MSSIGISVFHELFAPSIILMYLAEPVAMVVSVFAVISPSEYPRNEKSLPNFCTRYLLLFFTFRMTSPPTFISLAVDTTHLTSICVVVPCPIPPDVFK